MNYLYELLRYYDAQIDNIYNQRLKMIDECDNEIFNFVVKKIIEAFSLVHDIIIENFESYNQVLKILNYSHQIVDHDYFDDDRFT